MQVNSRFTFNKIRHDRDNDIHLVLDLVAPKAEFETKRAPLCIIPVLDCSVSMNDNNKLHYAKQSLLKLVDNLTSDDYMGLVSFGTDARPEAPPQRMTPENKAKFKKMIGDFEVRGNTNLSGGLLLALEMAKNTDLSDETLTRVILFTDGQPNVGVKTTTGLCDLLEKRMGHASVSTFGYGDDAAQDLLGEMATKGKGNFAYVQNPDAALSAFGKELGGLLSTYGQEIVVGIQPQCGHAISEVVSDAEVDEEIDGLVRIKLPEILSEETLHVVLSAKMAKQKTAGPRLVNAFDITVSYRSLDAEGKMVTHSVESKAKIQFVKDGEEQAQPTKEVDEVVARAQLVKAQIAAEEAAKRNDFAAANQALKGYQISAVARGHDHLGVVAGNVAGLYASNVSYASSGGRRRSIHRAAVRGMSASSLSVADQAMLSDAGYVVTNSSQAMYAQQFSEDQSTGQVVVTTPSDAVPLTANNPPLRMGSASSVTTSNPILWGGVATSGFVAPVSTTSVSTDGAQRTSSNSKSSGGRLKKNRSKRW